MNAVKTFIGYRYDARFVKKGCVVRHETLHRSTPNDTGLVTVAVYKTLIYWQLL